MFAGDHYRALFDFIDQGFCTVEVLFDQDGRASDYRFLDVNRAFVEQTGLENAVGRRMRELAPGHEPHWYEVYGRVALTGIPARFEQRAEALGRWYDVYAFRVGEPAARQIAILFSDITARRRAEQRLHDSETRYRALAHATSNSLARFNAAGTHLIEVYGGSAMLYPETNQPSTSWLEDYIHPDDRERMREAWRDGTSRGEPFEIEVRARFTSGGWGWFAVRAVPVRNEQGTTTEWIASATDISARKKAEEALLRSEADHRAARGEAEQANLAKDQFLAMLGHELRNPLAPMATALQLMRLRGETSREQDVLERQVKHLTRLVDDLLDISRVTRGKIELQKKPVEVADVVARSMELAGPMLEQRRSVVDIEVPAGLVIDADKDRMAQVISNLLTNAAKYSESGSRIAVKGHRRGESVHLSVRDRGIGIAPEMLASIFDAFVQQPQSLDRAEGGLGLGLAIVRTIVAAHGGTVRAASGGRNQGSEFIVELPAMDRVRPPDRETGAPPLGATDVLLKQRVLVVDDNEDAANLLGAALETLGHVVEMAFDGPSALMRVESFRPTAVLLDIGLPGMDGYEVARRLRSHNGDESMRLIAVTGYGQAADRARAEKAGFEHHLVKPVALGELERILGHGPPR